MGAVQGARERVGVALVTVLAARRAAAISQGTIFVLSDTTPTPHQIERAYRAGLHAAHVGQLRNPFAEAAEVLADAWARGYVDARAALVPTRAGRKGAAGR